MLTLNPHLELHIGIALVGALASAAIAVILWRLPRRAMTGVPQKQWLIAWVLMAAHFALQTAARAQLARPLTNPAANLLLVAAFWAFCDWAVNMVWPRLRWGLRAWALAMAVWMLAAPNWHGFLLLAGLGLMLTVGAVAALRLPWRTGLSRGILAAGMLGWAFGIGLLPDLMIRYGLLSGSLIDAETLVSKILCGLAMVLVVLDEQRDFLNDLFEFMPSPYYIFNPDNQIVEINQSGLDMLELPRDQVLGRTIRDFCTPESIANLPDWRQRMAILRAGGEIEPMEMELVSRTGRRYVVHNSVGGIYGPRRQFIGARSVLQDLSRERSLRQQLMQAQHLQAVGTLAAGIAHDFNNLLTVVLGQIEQLRRHGPQLPPESLARLDKAEAAARRGAHTVERLLSYAQPSREFQLLDLAELVRAFGDELRASLPAHIELECRAAPGLPLVQGNAEQLRMVLRQLARNAEQAMTEAGRLEIELIRPDDPAPAALLSVRDNGRGVPPELLPRIFDPFFTTRFPGQGTGLGLAMAQSIMNAHGGHIEVSSRPGQGTQVLLRFPAAAAAQAARA